MPTIDPRSTSPATGRRSDLLVAPWVLLILVATLRPGGPEASTSGAPWCLVCGPDGGADVVRNVVLFAPLGAALVLAGLRGPRAVLVALALTLSIEAAQSLDVIGRAATASDVLANTVGAALGAVAAGRRRLLLLPSPAVARRLAAGAWILVVAVMLVGAWMVTPAPPPPGTTLMRFPPRSDQVRRFEGHVVAATLNGRSMIGPRAGGVADPARLPPASPVVVEATVHAMYAPGMLRPLVYAFTPAWDDVLIVGQRRRRLVMRLRTHAAHLRLDDVQLELAEAFPPDAAIPPGDDPRRGPEVRVRAALADGRVRLDAWDARGHDRSVLSLSPHLLWSFFAAPLRVDAHTIYVSALWVALLFVPVAFWTRWAHRSRAVAAPALLIGGSALVLLAVPALAGLPPPAWWEFAGAAIGLAAGWLLAGCTASRALRSLAGDRVGETKVAGESSRCLKPEAPDRADDAARGARWRR